MSIVIRPDWERIRVTKKLVKAQEKELNDSPNGSNALLLQRARAVHKAALHDEKLEMDYVIKAPEPGAAG